MMFTADNTLPSTGDLLMNKQKTIGIIVSSTRPGRICKEIAEWVLGIVQANSSLNYNLIDLAEITVTERAVMPLDLSMGI
jgi:hypothetical protein